MPTPAAKKEVKKKKKSTKAEAVDVPKELADQFDPIYLENVIQLFTIKDKKGEGFLDVSELGLMLRQLGGNPTEGEIEEWTKEIRLEEDKMDLMGFLKSASYELKTHKTDADIVVAFQILDHGKKGVVSDTILRDFLTRKCESLPNSVVDQFFTEANTNRNENGDIKYEDFVAKVSKETQAFWNKKAKKMGLSIPGSGGGKGGKKGKAKKGKKKK